VFRFLRDPGVSRGRRRRAAGERGQVVGMVVVSLVTVLGASALVLDVGSHYVEKRKSQDAADAAALAAAQQLPTATSSAMLTSLSSFDQKNDSRGTYNFTVSQSTGASAPDTVAVAVNSTDPGVFSRVFGIASVNVTTQATARLATYTEFGTGIGPWAIDTPTYNGLTFNASGESNVTCIKDGGGNGNCTGTISPGNFGRIQPPNTGSSCAAGGGGGTNIYRDLITGAIQACALEAGDSIYPQTGNGGSNTGSALTTRGAVTPFDPSTLWVQDGNGNWGIKNFANPNLVIIPVIVSFPNGNHPITIVSFHYFIITSYTADEVEGVFVQPPSGTMSGPNGAICAVATNTSRLCATTSYTGSGTSTIRLVG
jgi:Flp pilus assembly protein TadG